MRGLFSHGFIAQPAMPPVVSPPLRVLVLGIYLTDHANQAERLVTAYGKSKRHVVEQRWGALGQTQTQSARVAAVTVCHSHSMVPKFQLLNEMLAQVDLDRYDYVVFSDDDVALCPNFVDAYLGWAHYLGLSVSQPARTRFSYRDHKFCLQLRGVKARETRFVEIGPVFMFDRLAVRALLPFDETSPMGWGYDYVWPKVAQKAQMRMGIVDTAPVDHSYRAQNKTYGASVQRLAMERLFEDRGSVSDLEAKVNLKVYL